MAAIGELQVGADRERRRHSRPALSLQSSLLGLGERQEAGRRPDEVDDRPVGLLVRTCLDGSIDDCHQVVETGSLPARRLLGEEVDPGVHLGEGVVDPQRDGDRLLRVRDRLVAMLQHLDLREPSECSRELG